MSWSLRRAVLALATATIICTVVFITQADFGMAQQPVGKIALPPIMGPPPMPNNGQPKDPTEFSHAIELPRNPDAGKKVEAAKDYIRDKDWEVACRVLQDLLMLDQDYFTKVPRQGPDGKETISFVSVKAEADRLIANLPEKGKEWYKLNYGAKAAELLKTAKESSDVQQLNVITRFYLHTEAGMEATNLLGTYHLDRGNYTTAGLCYEKLLNGEGSDKLSPITLWNAAYAFRMTGSKANEDACWQKLNTRLHDIRFANDTKSIEELRSYLAKADRPALERAYDTPMVGGSPQRTSPGFGGAAFLQHNWKVALNRTGESKGWIAEAERLLQERAQPVLSAMQPITATVMKDEQKLALVVYRSHWGIHAVDMKTGKTKWETPSMWSLDAISRNTKVIGTINQWIGQHLQLHPNILLENSTIGTLSTDGAHVFAIDDLAVPPDQNQNQMQMWNGRGVQNFNNEDISNAVNASKLQSFDLATGKLIWQIGGVKDKDDRAARLAPDLQDSYFLGAPVPLGGKLYVLTEKQQDLRLATLDPATGKQLSVQTLATARDKMMMDVWRRIQATHLAYGEGILVCPTNAGAILGVDLLSNSLVWAYPYRDKNDGAAEQLGDDENPGFRKGFGRRGFQPQPAPGWVQGPDGRWHNPDINTQWKVSPPMIVDGKVVFTAPDANMIHCINLRDGGHAWSQKRGADDLYLAGVFCGKAIIVGKGYTRALSLSKGAQVWRVDTGIPSGYGAASDNIFYLPLKEGKGQNHEPGICAIDIEKGQMVAYNKSHKKEVPGNILFYEGDVLSQTATDLTVFPQMAVKLAEIDKSLGTNPNDPVGLLSRGEMRLDKGDLPGAIDDLRRSLKNNPKGEGLQKAREKLLDSFTEYFQNDFNKAEEFIKEYEDLCKLDAGTTKADQHRRRRDFLCLVGKGKEAQGKLVEAFEKYRQLAGEADNEKQELISVVDEPGVQTTPEVWSGGRIAAMIAKASPEQRKPLEDLIKKQWNELKETEDIDEIKSFVRVFGSLFSVGKEARLELANRLMEDTSATALLEAEQHLSLLRVPGENPALAGRAVEALARLNTRKGLLEDASYYYRLLRDEYGKVIIRDGKTGADLFDDMATDKRLLPYLDIPMNFGMIGKYIKLPVVEERGTPFTQQVYEFGHVGESIPFFQRHRMGFHINYHQLKITDTSNPALDKSLNLLPKTNFQQMVYGNGTPNQARYNYMTQGHLMVLPVVNMVFGIDPVRGEVLWQRNLFGERNPNVGQPPGQPPQWNQFIVDPKDGSVMLMYPGWVQRLGGAGTLESGVLCLQTRDGLIAIDPVTNKPLWTRPSSNLNCQLFNDDRHVYVVEMTADGNPASTRVLRAYDGVSVDVPDFAALYQRRLRQIGRHLLLSETGKGQLTFRLYDVLTGKDAWTATYPANSTVLKSEDERFIGAIEPNGTVRVLDVRNGKEALKAQMEVKYLEKMQSVHLLYDGQYFFVACNGQADPNLIQFGGVLPNVMPTTGLRELPVNGEIYCFEAATGKRKWHVPLLNQMIMLDHFGGMPIILATSRYNAWLNGAVGRQVTNTVVLEAIVKSSGKFVYQRRDQQWAQFHALNLDPKKGTIELVNHQNRIVFTVTNEPPAPKN